jgi:hypothetical protein
VLRSAFPIFTRSLRDGRELIMIARMEKTTLIGPTAHQIDHSSISLSESATWD